VKTLRHYHSLRTLLLLAVVLLAAQSLALWHSHDKADSPETTCQLCVHAQQHTPVPTAAVVHALALFAPIAVNSPQDIETTHFIYRIYIPSRAPPANCLV